MYHQTIAPVCQEELPCLDHRFYSVEMPLNQNKMKYQCKLRKNGMTSMFVLVKEDSDILNCLNEGDVMTMTFYGADLKIPPENLDAEIKYITKTDGGKFRGHYLVGLDILHKDHQISIGS